MSENSKNHCKNKNKNQMEKIDTYYKANTLHFEHIGWKYYSRLKKKAVEQEFSPSGLIISLSIAFFIVISTALVLSFVYNSVNTAQVSQEETQKVYFLESTNSYSLIEYKASC
ncbi:hypothetical protein KAI92_00505 [Candidatus Parcubacteria bacterium]|nr:hypothetical protein [Candidatus Parcubacteria bacterium]